MSSERNRSMPDDLRALGLTVAVHNDYRLNDVPHTFWLMTLPNEDGTALAFKGEGVNDADALDQIRAQVKRHFNLEGPSPAPPDIGVNGTLRYMLENPPSPMFPCACDGELKVTSVPCPTCVRVRYPSADALRQAMQGDALLVDLTAAGATRFAPAHLTARRCSPTHLQLLDDGLVTADWWPTTGKARATGPSGGVAAPHKLFTVDALVEWLKGL